MSTFRLKLERATAWCVGGDAAALVAYMDTKPSDRLNVSHRQTVYIIIYEY